METVKEVFAQDYLLEHIDGIIADGFERDDIIDCYQRAWEDCEQWHVELKRKKRKPLSELHKDPETCEEIARLMEFKLYLVEQYNYYIRIIMVNEDGQYFEMHIGHTGLIDWRNEDVAPNYYQIVSLLIDRGYVIGKV